MVGERVARRSGTRLCRRRWAARGLSIERRIHLRSRQRSTRRVRRTPRIRRPSALGGQALVHAAAARVECVRKALAELAEELILQGKFFFPRTRLDAAQLAELRLGKLTQPLPVEILEARHGAERCFHAARAALRALEDPLQNPHVLAES